MDDCDGEMVFVSKAVGLKEADADAEAVPPPEALRVLPEEGVPDALPVDPVVLDDEPVALPAPEGEALEVVVAEAEAAAEGEYEDEALGVAVREPADEPDAEWLAD